MSEVLFWVLSALLFLAAVSCAVFGVLARGHENSYLTWASWVAWAVLSIALAFVLRAGLL